MAAAAGITIIAIGEAIGVGTVTGAATAIGAGMATTAVSKTQKFSLSRP